MTNQVIALRRAGVDTLMIFGTPTPTIRTYATMAAIGWKPQNIFLNSVSATDTFMGIAVARAGRRRGERLDQHLLHQGPGEPGLEQRRRDEALQVDHGQVRARRTRRSRTALYIYGMAKAYTFIQALKAAGPNPTRASLMKAVLNMNDKSNPFLLPGVVTKTGRSDYFPISQQQLIRFNNGTGRPMGQLTDTRPRG